MNLFCFIPEKKLCIQSPLVQFVPVQSSEPPVVPEPKLSCMSRIDGCLLFGDFVKRNELGTHTKGPCDICLGQDVFREPIAKGISFRNLN